MSKKLSAPPRNTRVRCSRVKRSEIEEVWFESDQWFVTIELERPEPTTGMEILISKRSPYRIHYKTVCINDATKDVKFVKNRENIPVSPL